MHNPAETNGDPSEMPSAFDRRTLLVTSGAVATSAVLGAWAYRATLPTAPVFIARNQRYDGSLVQTIRDGLAACGTLAAEFRGRKVLLKPNLVEPRRDRPHMTTHPAVIAAAAEVFRGWGAQLTVGEAPGHVRDTELALAESGVGEALADAGLEFADLNYEEVGKRENRGGYCTLGEFYLPRSVLEADYVVSMPKMKTHHHVGVTASMKNLYGVLPGIKYGWPKNVLHHHGIPQTVADIASSLPQTLAIVDGIDCMEGDGPILGSKKHMGLVVVGRNLPAVDATVTRIMGLVPERIDYLRLVADDLGPIAERRIEQRGQRWQSVASPFAVLDQPHLKHLRATSTGPLVT
jgi:uncharacterized protein (DUF362 family)